MGLRIMLVLMVGTVVIAVAMIVGRYVLRTGLRRMRMSLSFHYSREVCGEDAQDEQSRQLEAVVGVQLDFRHQVSDCDTEEDPGRKGEDGPDHQSLVGMEPTDAHQEEDDSGGAHKPKEGIDRLPPAGFPAPCGHQGGDGHGIEGFVEDDCEKGGKSG